MNTTSFVVCGFHQGRKLKPQHFPTEALAREHASYMSRTLDCVVLSTRTTVPAAPSGAQLVASTGLNASAVQAEPLALTG